jgi:hypothetical protein
MKTSTKKLAALVLKWKAKANRLHLKTIQLERKYKSATAQRCEKRAYLSCAKELSIISKSE